LGNDLPLQMDAWFQELSEPVDAWFHDLSEQLDGWSHDLPEQEDGWPMIDLSSWMLGPLLPDQLDCWATIIQSS
jgi:hypothetical protein